jgi:hypothetical protein
MPKMNTDLTITTVTQLISEVSAAVNSVQRDHHGIRLLWTRSARLATLAAVVLALCILTPTSPYGVVPAYESAFVVQGIAGVAVNALCLPY